MRLVEHPWPPSSPSLNARHAQCRAYSDHAHALGDAAGEDDVDANRSEHIDTSAGLEQDQCVAPLPRRGDQGVHGRDWHESLILVHRPERLSNRRSPCR